MSKAIALPCVLSALWLGLSAKFTPLLLGLGALSVGLVLVLSRRMDRVDGARPVLELSPIACVRYAVWLLGQVVLANLDVARRILSPDLPISPRVVRVEASQRSAFAQVVFANSITLTPGTVSMELQDGVIEVHALTEEAAAGLRNGEMDRRVVELERPA